MEGLTIVVAELLLFPFIAGIAVLCEGEERGQPVLVDTWPHSLPSAGDSAFV